MAGEWRLVKATKRRAEGWREKGTNGGSLLQRTGGARGGRHDVAGNSGHAYSKGGAMLVQNPRGANLTHPEPKRALSAAHAETAVSICVLGGVGMSVGMRTVSTRWTTPFSAATSAVVTVASLILMLLVVGCAFCASV